MKEVKLLKSIFAESKIYKPGMSSVWYYLVYGQVQSKPILTYIWQIHSCQHSFISVSPLPIFLLSCFTQRKGWQKLAWIISHKDVTALSCLNNYPKQLKETCKYLPNTFAPYFSGSRFNEEGKGK